MAFRSVALVLLLFGSLLPGGTVVQLVAAIVAAPLVVVEIMGPLLTRLWLHTSVIAVVVVFSALLVPAALLPVTGSYGEAKVYELATYSLGTALAASIIRDRDHLSVLARMWVVLGLVVSVLALTGGTGTADRAVGLGANPIGLARAIALALVAVVWLMINRRIRILPGWGVVVVLVLGVFATGSKGPMLGAAVACAVIVLAASERRGLRLVQFLLVAGVGYVVVRFVPYLATSRLGAYVLDPLGVRDDVRSSALDATVGALSVEGWRGSGYGSWSWVARYPLMDYPHNVWAELLVEAGLLSTLMVAGFLAYVLLRLVRNASPAAQLSAAWLATEAVSASLSGDVRARAFWFFLVLGYVVARWGREAPPGASGRGDSGQRSERSKGGRAESEDRSAIRDRAAHRGNGRVAARAGRARRRHLEHPVR